MTVLQKNPRDGNARIRLCGRPERDSVISTYLAYLVLLARYEVEERAFTRSRVRVTGRTRWPSRSTSWLGRAREALRQPDLLPSPVIIIIKSTLRAVRALVKECFISPTRHSAPAHWTAAFRQPPGLQHHLQKTTLAVSRPFEPAGRISLFLLAVYPATIPRTLKPTEGCFLPSAH